MLDYDIGGDSTRYCCSNFRNTAKGTIAKIFGTKETEFNVMDLVKKTNKYSAADIATICKDALRKNVIEGGTKIDKQDLFWAINEQKRRKGIMLTG